MNSVSQPRRLATREAGVAPLSASSSSVVEARKYRVESEEAGVMRDELKDQVFQTKSTCTVRITPYEDAGEGLLRWLMTDPCDRKGRSLDV